MAAVRNSALRTARSTLPFASTSRLHPLPTLAARALSSSPSCSSSTPSSSSPSPKRTRPSSSTASPSSNTLYSVPSSPSTDTPPELPFLPRPLGVKQPPNTESKTWQEKKEELLDRDKHLAKRKELVQEATRGYFHDYNAMRREGGHGGKTWIAPSVLIREDRALYFPDISGTSLVSRSITSHTTDLCKGKVSLVTVLNTRISEEHVNSFATEALKDWEGREGFNYVQINHQANPFKSLLLQFFMSSLKRTMSEERWPNYMIAGGEWGGLKEPLGISNKHVGYVYLVDPNLKIRWAGCGYAEAREKDGLRKGLAVLMGRLENGKGTF